MYLTTGELDQYTVPVIIPESQKSILIAQASNLIDGYCHRSLKVQSFTETIPLNEANMGRLRNIPITGITTIEARYSPENNPLGYAFSPPDWEAITGHDFNPNNGRIWLPTGLVPVAYQEARVTYQSGYTITPEQIKLACGMLVVQLKTRRPGVVSVRDEGTVVQYASESLITPEIQSLLAPYKLLLVG